MHKLWTAATHATMMMMMMTTTTTMMIMMMMIIIIIIISLRSGRRQSPGQGTYIGMQIIG